ncbi:MAG: hypothetical protein A2Y33_01095 [Spirochaetes bacterium GWF1_51_8]|nr:MAG: hypothetical protein A2Y33_01095 [Spirochaetes bacterium GWF1_51_8]
MKFTYLKNGESLALSANSCTGCGTCVEVCPHEVFDIREKKAVIVNRNYCMECGACALNCPAGALEVKSGVGCAAAVLSGLLKGKEASCGGDGDSSCGCDSQDVRSPVLTGRQGAGRSSQDVRSSSGGCC